MLCKEIENNKNKSLMYLKNLDNEMIKLLEKVDKNKKIVFDDGVWGKHKVSLNEVLHYLIGHEYYHQGIFTCYGRMAGLGKFTFM